MKYFKIIRDGLKDPKKKSLTLLGIYFIFFVFVYIVLNGSNSNQSSTAIVDKSIFSEYYNSISGYKYKITYNDLEGLKTVEGTYCKDKSLFTYNGMKYYFENDLLYLIDNDSYYLSNIEYNVSKLFNKNLYTILRDLKEESKTTYNDGTTEMNYSIDSNVLYNYLYDTTSEYSNLVNLKIIQSNDNIIMNFNLTNLGINLSEINVEYSNINNIKDLEFNKDNYIYRE